MYVSKIVLFIIAMTSKKSLNIKKEVLKINVDILLVELNQLEIYLTSEG